MRSRYDRIQRAAVDDFGIVAILDFVIVAAVDVIIVASFDVFIVAVVYIITLVDVVDVMVVLVVVDVIAIDIFAKVGIFVSVPKVVDQHCSFLVCCSRIFASLRSKKYYHLSLRRRGSLYTY